VPAVGAAAAGARAQPTAGHADVAPCIAACRVSNSNDASDLESEASTGARPGLAGSAGQHLRLRRLPCAPAPPRHSTQAVWPARRSIAQHGCCRCAGQPACDRQAAVRE
jgi:hypothetical protein